MSISRKLKELLVAFGAAQNVNALKSNRIDSLIGTLAAWIAEHGGGGGSDLPTPGTAGNVLTSTGDAWESAAPSAPLPAAGADGNVLTADDGEWVSAAPADDEFLIETTIAVPSMVVANAHVPFADMVAALNAGKTVKGIMKNEDYGTIVVGYATMQYSENGVAFIAAGYDTTPNRCTFYCDARPANEGQEIEFTVYSYEALLPPLVITATTADDTNGALVTITGATLPEICAAAAAKKRPVVCDYEVAQGINIRMALSGYAYTDDNNCSASFYADNTDTYEIQTRVILLRIEPSESHYNLYKLTRQLGA